MPDEEHDEQQEERHFNRQEAEKLLPLLERLLTGARDRKKRAEEIEGELSEVRARILHAGGLLPSYGRLAERKLEMDSCLGAIREAIAQIHRQGCLVKDLDLGLIDFPTLVGDETVYLCWKLGEDRIAFWHRTDEGYAARKPLDHAGESGPAPFKPN